MVFYGLQVIVYAWEQQNCNADAGAMNAVTDTISCKSCTSLFLLARRGRKDAITATDLRLNRVYERREERQ